MLWTEDQVGGMSVVETYRQSTKFQTRNFAVRSHIVPIVKSVTSPEDDPFLVTRWAYKPTMSETAILRDPHAKRAQKRPYHEDATLKYQSHVCHVHYPTLDLYSSKR